jgi:endonuclease VIII
MPEGDTVWNTARLLDRALAGQALRHADFRVPALATVDLTGWRVLGCASRGKHLLLRVSEPAATGGARASGAGAAGQGRALTLHSHLRMDGSWRIYGPGEPWRGKPAHQIRVVLRTLPAVAVGYHLHDLALIATDREETLVGHLGPDLLGPPGQPGGWDAVEAVRRLRSRPDATIAEALLDQRCLAGLGNLYKAEVLFLRGVHPRTLVSTVDNLEAMVGLAHRLINANRGRWTQATTGSTRRGEEVYVYGRPGAPCRRCGTPIRSETLGERITYWCPACQPEPTRADAATP